MRKRNFLLILAFVASFTVKAQFVALEVDCYKVDASSFAIDGLANESFWQSDAIQWQSLAKVATGTTTASDYSAKFKVAYDADYLYLFVRVTDDVLLKYEDYKTGNFYGYDHIEIFFNPSGVPNDGAWLGTRDSQLRCNVGSDGLATGGGFCTSNIEANAISGYDYTHAVTTDGYDVEIQIPWYAVIPAAYDYMIDEDNTIGFDVNGGDADVQNVRKTIVSWSSPNTDNWRWNTSYGFLNFKGELPTGINNPSLQNLNYTFANGKLQFKNLQVNSTATVYNASGQTLISQQIKDNFLNLSSLKSGVYIVQVKTPQASYTIKVIK
jgi:hypothetical protein